MLLDRPDLLWYRGQGTSAGFVGHSALHYAAAKGHLDILMMLLASGSDVGARNRGGTTPLHSAAMNDHGQIVTILLRCGADPYVGDQDGERAEEGARRRGKMSGANAIAAFRSGGRVEGVDAVCAGSRQAEKLKAWVEKFEKAKREWLSSGKHAEVQEAARESAAAACAAAAEASQDKSGAGKGGGLATNKRKKEGSGGAEKAGGGKESAGGAQGDDSSSSSDDAGVDYAEKIAAMKQKGNAAFARGEYTAAIGAYSMAVSCSKMSGAGGHYILLSNRSAAYCGAGNYEKALADAEAVVESEPGWAKGYSRLGAALHGCARWAEAAKAYGKGLKIAPDDVKLREGLDETIARVREATGTEPTWLMQDA
jgi:tetratricopeptide (TPR) repeat protein